MELEACRNTIQIGSSNRVERAIGDATAGLPPTPTALAGFSATRRDFTELNRTADLGLSLDEKTHRNRC